LSANTHPLSAFFDELAGRGGSSNESVTDPPLPLSPFKTPLWGSEKLAVHLGWSSYYYFHSIPPPQTSVIGRFCIVYYSMFGTLPYQKSPV
jgi:hypothetical protein